MPDEADEAGGHQPANEETEVRCGFSPEKPCLPLSIEGKIAGADISFALCGDSNLVYHTCVYSSAAVLLTPYSHSAPLILLFFCNCILFCSIPVDNTVLLW